MDTCEESPTPDSAVKTLSIIWDDDKIEKVSDNNFDIVILIVIYSKPFYLVPQYVDKDGCQQWKCLWCGKSFLHWNATKALFHVNKESGGNVRRCSSNNIDQAHKTEYRRLLQKYSQQKQSQKTLVESKKRSLDEYLADAGKAYNSTRKRNPSPAIASHTQSPAEPTSIVQPTAAHLKFGDETPTNTPTDVVPRYYQQKLSDVVDPQSEAQLTMAIADLIHSCGLPFSLASHHKFQRVLTLAKVASKKYIPPGRNKVAGELLDLNYQIYKQKMMEMLQKDADIYGITFFGDGATVKKSPLINILASSVHLPVGCLRIVDCTGHLESDGKKDASFISQLFLPHVMEMEDKVPKCTDLVIFDGASNVQKAGQLLAAKFPHISVIHGAEHVISLFYRDVFNLREFEILKRLNRLIYRYFGSGAMHSPYAIFSKHSRDHNGGKAIGLIRAADTRMAGHVISIMRTLRLKHPLISTITSASFIQGKFKVSRRRYCWVSIHTNILTSNGLFPYNR